MLKKFLKKLSAYPRLRILLLIVLVIIIFIIAANLIGLLTPASKGAGIAGSDIQSAAGNNTQTNQALVKRYELLANKRAKAEYFNNVEHGGSSFSGGLGQPKSPALNTHSNTQSSQKIENKKQPKTLTPEQYAKLLENQLGHSSKLSQSNAQSGSKSKTNSQNIAQSQSQIKSELEQPVRSNINNRFRENLNSPQAQTSNQYNPYRSSRPYQYAQTSPSSASTTQLETAMQQKMQQMKTAWSITPATTVKGEIPTAKKAKAKPVKSIAVKAGTVYYGVLLTAVDSDQKSAPILAQMVSGPFKGARLMGGFTLEGKKLVVQFTRMSLPNLNHSISISAYAINGVTAQNALASSVNNHYLYRYGSLFAAAFLEGFGNAYNDWQPCPSGSDNCTVIVGGQPSKPTTKQAFYQGLGQIGTTLGQNIAENFNMPPTVKLNQGMGIGILFMSDVKI